MSTFFSFISGMLHFLFLGMGYSVFGLEASAIADAEVLLIGLVVDDVS